MIRVLLRSRLFFIIFIVLSLFFCSFAQDSLRVRTKGLGAKPDEAVRNAKVVALLQAGWSVVEEYFYEIENKAQMKTKIIDMKKLADSSYQVIIDASVKTIYESTIIGAGVFVIAAITSMVLILTWGAIKATGG